MDLSVVVPTYRRPVTLRRVLDRLAGQEADFEVLVVDDPAADDAAAVAAAIGERPYPVRQLHSGFGPAPKRNVGWRAAAAPLVLFLDDDVLPGPRLLAEHLAAHRREPADTVAVLGSLEWARELRVTPFMRFVERGLQFDYAGIPGDDAGWGRFYTANVSVKRALLERSGGFDEGFAFAYEDLELARRLHDLGMTLRYVPAARAEHLHAVTLEEFERRMAAVAAGERRMAAKHPDFRPYFEELFRAAVRDEASGRGRRLVSVVPESVPVLGPRVHASARAWWRRRLGQAFLAAWSSAGSEPGGPK